MASGRGESGDGLEEISLALSLRRLVVARAQSSEPQSRRLGTQRLLRNICPPRSPQVSRVAKPIRARGRGDADAACGRVRARGLEAGRHPCGAALRSLSPTLNEPSGRSAVLTG